MKSITFAYGHYDGMAKGRVPVLRLTHDQESDTNFGSISVGFLSASDGTGAECMAVRLSPCEFKRLQAR